MTRPLTETERRLLDRALHLTSVMLTCDEARNATAREIDALRDVIAAAEITIEVSA